MFYLVKTPWIIKRLIYSDYVWSMPETEKKIYLTFDDGPHPEATRFVLEELGKFNAKATFFCVGKNVVEYPEIHRMIIEQGHSVGNHTQNHLNGWSVSDEAYLEDVGEASNHIRTSIFRPPYGKINRSQAKLLKEKFNYSIIMWSILSGDFDQRLAPEKCVTNIFRLAGPGSVIVFHDSAKAFRCMRYALPLVLETFTIKGYFFDKIPDKISVSK